MEDTDPRPQAQIPTGTVWLLGAGFSHPLGGPLMDQLFTPALRHRMQPWLTKVPDAAWKGQFIDLEQFFHRHNSHGLPDDFDVRPWRDAEEFLETLDRAIAGGDEHKDDRAIALGLVQGRNEHRSAEELAREMAKQARRYLVAALHSFAPVGDVTRIERWAPYARWASNLNANDAVISFNYDRVVELASCGRITPASTLAKGKKIYSMFNPGHPWFLKMHGSIGWKFDKDGNVEENENPLSCLTDSSVLPVIASPGPSKLRMTTELFHGFWLAAEEALKAAGRIVFLGYRAPPTDNEAKRRIIDAIRANQNPDLRVHIVLGPNTSHDHVRRLEAMLGWALLSRPVRRKLSPQLKPTVEPMGAEDFLMLAGSI